MCSAQSFLPGWKVLRMANFLPEMLHNCRTMRAMSNHPPSNRAIWDNGLFIVYIISLRAKILTQFSFTALEPVSRFKFQMRLHIFHWIFCQTSIVPWRSELDRNWNVRLIVFNVMLLHQCLQWSCNNSTFLNSQTRNAVRILSTNSSESSRASGKLSVSFPLCLALSFALSSSTFVATHGGRRCTSLARGFLLDTGRLTSLFCERGDVCIDILILLSEIRPWLACFWKLRGSNMQTKISRPRLHRLGQEAFRGC